MPRARPAHGRVSTQRKSCDTCHKSKTKCDRRRPICSTCHIFGRRCTYDVRDKYGTVVRSVSSSQDDTAAAAAPPPPSRDYSSPAGVSQQLPSNITQPDQGTARSNYYSSTFSAGSYSKTARSSLSSVRSSFTSSDQDPEPGSSTSASPTGLHPACGFCFEAGCEFCQLSFDNDSPSRPTDASPTASPYSGIEGVSLATSILQAMSVGSDSQSSMILAALRTGTSQHRIGEALVSPDYESKGLAYILTADKLQSNMKQQAKGVDNEASQSPDMPYARFAWDSIVFDLADSARQTSDELSGTLVPARKRAKSTAEVPTLVQAPSASGASAIRLPFWSLLPMQLTSKMSDPFDVAMDQIRTDIAGGVDIDTYCGSHAYLVALIRPETKERIPRLSRIVADLVRHFMPQETTPSVTSLAIMWLHWCLWSWMISPTAESFERMPKIMRPMPWQICSAHPLLYDFVIVPSLRDHICRKPVRSNTWVTEATGTILCDWPKTALHALCRNRGTGAIDLNRDCKLHASMEANWSFGPSLRAHIPDLDQYAKVRVLDSL